MESRHPVEGFVSEVSSICNHCGVMTAWISQETLKTLAKRLRYLEKRLPTGKFSKLCSESIYRLTDQRQIGRCCHMQILWNVADWKAVKSCVIYLTKTIFRFPLLLSLLTDRAQSLPGPAPDSVLRMLHISSKSVYFRRSYSRTREHRRNVA